MVRMHVGCLMRDERSGLVGIVECRHIGHVVDVLVRVCMLFWEALRRHLAVLEQRRRLRSRDHELRVLLLSLNRIGLG